MAGIKIQFLADVANFLRGTKDIESALDDVDESLDDLATEAAKAGRDAGEDLADGITDGTKDADEALGKLEKSFKDALNDVSKQSKTAGDDLGTHVKKGADKADEGVKDLKENSKQNLKETAASIHSVGDALDGLQGLASEALEGFGPAGALAGAALAAGLGIAVTKFQEQKEKLKQAVSDLGDALVAGGGTIARDSIIDKIQSFVSDGTINKLADQARAAHVDVNDFLLALSGDPDALARATKQLDDYEHSVEQTSDGTNKFKDEGAISAVGKQLNGQAKALGLASEAFGHYDDAAAATSESQQAQVEAFEDAQDALTDYGDALEGIADPIDSFNTALSEGGKQAKVTIADMIRDLEDKAADRAKFEKNLRTLAAKGGGALIAELTAKGPEAAGAVTAVLAKGTSSQVQAYAKLHGGYIGQSVGSGMVGAIAATDLTVGVNSSVNAAEHTMEQKGAALSVPVKADTRGADKDIKALAQTILVTLDYKIGKDRDK